MDNIEVKIKKKMNRKTKEQNAVDIFNVNTEADNKEKQAQRHEEEDNDDYVIGGNIVNTDVANANNQANLDVQKNIWEENKGEAVVYNEAVVVVEEPKKKVAGWGDGISKKKNVVQAINEEELYFPDLNNPNAKKQAPKPKPKPTMKNEHLFGDSSNFSQPKVDDRFTATNAIKFTNSKGVSDKLAKLQATGPVYDANLEDDNLASQNTAGEEPIKFKGKISLLGEETDADKQRAAFMKEIAERQNNEVEKKKTVWQTSEVKEETRFFNSKGTSKLNGFMRQDNNNASNNLEDSAGKRQFTNSKKVNNGFKAPELDPNVPTVDNKHAVTAKVTLKGWD